MKKTFLFLIIILQTTILSCQNISNDSLINTKNTSKKEISLLFLGDIMQHDLQIESAYNSKTKTYDFTSQFKHIQPIIKDVDAVVGNFEVTLSGKPYKGYPRFSSPNQLAFDIKKSGINYLVTANNHIYDYGVEGFKKTLKMLDSADVIHTGTFSNLEDKKKHQPMIIEKNGFKIALLSYTYGVNGDEYSSSILINEIDEELIKSNLKTLQKSDYDAIIVFFHWGKEYERESNQEQKKFADLCFENGADIVIGSHPHVIQEMNSYRYKEKSGKEKDVFVAYSLGNFVSNYGTWRYCDGGAMVKMKLTKNSNGELKIENPGYFLVWVYRPKKEKTAKLLNYYVLPVSQFENDKTLGAEHLKQMKTFINDSRTLLNKNNKNVNEYKYDVSTEKWKLTN
ncbi:MAG: CapA family protein [Bacteroidales bacterium]|nr:CapA family protein [Bacteroidales bacterium]MBN2757067.1 CapA family protein [Bacteroidales bacterium]